MACQTKKFKFCTQQVANLVINMVWRGKYFLLHACGDLMTSLRKHKIKMAVVDIKVDHC
jgi:hypothetical protein